jgi:hypothetical protein
VSQPGNKGKDGRQIVFMCAGTGAVVSLSFVAGPRPALGRAVVFLASGETLWIDGGSSGGTMSSLAVRERGSGSQSDLRLSATAVRLTGPTELISAEPPAGRRAPVGVELTLEPASQQLALGAETLVAGGYVTLLRGAGSLAVGSVIHPVEGTAWLATGPGGGPGGEAGCRAQAVFQDGSALYVAAGDGPLAAGDDLLAALVHNTHIRATAVRDFTGPRSRYGPTARSVTWAAAGRSPAGATAEIRDPQQQLTVRPEPDGSGDPAGRSWNGAPFVFVRSGVTGLGLIEWWDQPISAAAAVAAAEPADELPDPY